MREPFDLVCLTKSLGPIRVMYQGRHGPRVCVAGLQLGRVRSAVPEASLAG